MQHEKYLLVGGSEKMTYALRGERRMLSHELQGDNIPSGSPLFLNLI
jgi:hypothetical protein